MRKSCENGTIFAKFREIFVFTTIFAKTSRKFRENEKSIKFDRAETKISFSRKCKNLREKENKFLRKCENENFPFNPSRTFITYSFSIKILFFLPANSPWLRLVLVRPDLSSIITYCPEHSMPNVYLFF
jgi:hypothetical protein